MSATVLFLDEWYGNLYPGADLHTAGPLCAKCAKCGRTGHIWDSHVYPTGLIRVDGWEYQDSAWWVENPRCKDRAVCTLTSRAHPTGLLKSRALPAWVVEASSPGRNKNGNQTR